MKKLIISSWKLFIASNFE